MLTDILDRGYRPLGINPGLIAGGFQFCDALLERRIVQIRNTVLNGLIETFQPRVGLRRLLIHFSYNLTSPLVLLFSTAEMAGEHGFQALWIEQPIGKMIRDQMIQAIHTDRLTFATCLSLPRRDRAGIVAVVFCLPRGAERHGPATLGAETDAGQQRRTARDPRRCHHGLALLQRRLDGIEQLLFDERWHRDRDRFRFFVRGAILVALSPLMLADIGASCQDAVDSSDAPSSASPCVEFPFVEILGNRLDAHPAAFTITNRGEIEHQPYGLRMERIDFENLLDLCATLLSIDHAVADRRQRSVPETLPGIFLERPASMLGVLLGLILIKQRHDLAHHDVHGVIAEFLRHGEQFDTVPGKLSDIEFQLEMIPKEAAERVHDDDIEGPRLRGSSFHHALKLWALVIRRRCAGFDICLDQIISPRFAIGFTLATLIGD